MPVFSTTPELALPTRMPLAQMPSLPQVTPALPPTHTAVPTSVPSPTASATPAPTPTPDPYAGYTVADLRQRSYGGGELSVVEIMEQRVSFTRYLVTYPSDGLAIAGFMNVPRAPSGPLPVVLLLHGYVNPADYQTRAYTSGHADALAQAGYLVIHPNFRNYPPSDSGDNPFRAGFAVDVLNLIALVQAQGGRPGPLQLADPASISLWGHSMGGGVALRVLVVNPDIRAAVLYGAMSADEYWNYSRIFEWTDGRMGQDVLAINPADMARIAPVNFLADVNAAVAIHHGTADGQVPVGWSVALCDQLRALGRTVECYTYEGQPHFFWGDSDALFRQRVVGFLARYSGR